MTDSATLTWTCIVCGTVHPIDHAGMFISPNFMACISCERAVLSRQLGDAVMRQRATGSVAAAADRMLDPRDTTLPFVARYYLDQGRDQGHYASDPSRDGENEDIARTAFALGKAIRARYGDMPPPESVSRAKGPDHGGVYDSRARIIGCTCGWSVPAAVLFSEDADEAFRFHRQGTSP